MHPHYSLLVCYILRYLRDLDVGRVGCQDSVPLTGLVKFGKTPVKVLKDSPGFIVNRINAPDMLFFCNVLDKGVFPICFPISNARSKYSLPVNSDFMISTSFILLARAKWVEGLHSFLPNMEMR